MFGKKKDNVNKLSKTQEFGLKLLVSVADNIDKIVKECSSCSGSQYSMEVERTLSYLYDKVDSGLKEIQIINTLPFSDMEEIKEYE